MNIGAQRGHMTQQRVPAASHKLLIIPWGFIADVLTLPTAYVIAGCGYNLRAWNVLSTYG